MKSCQKRQRCSIGDVGRCALFPSFNSEQMICLWVIGVISKNIWGDNLSRAYFGSFSESNSVPSSGWMAFDEGYPDFTVHRTIPKKVRAHIGHDCTLSWIKITAQSILNQTSKSIKIFPFIYGNRLPFFLLISPAAKEFQQGMLYG